MGRRKKNEDELLDQDTEHTEEHDSEEHPEDAKKRKNTILSEQVVFPLGRAYLDDISVVDANGHCHRALTHYEPGGNSERITARKEVEKLIGGSKRKKTMAEFIRRYAEYEKTQKPFRDSRNRYAFAVVADDGQLNIVVSCNHAFPGLAGKAMLDLLKNLGL